MDAARRNDDRLRAVQVSVPGSVSGRNSIEYVIMILGGRRPGRSHLGAVRMVPVCVFNNFTLILYFGGICVAVFGRKQSG